jgi:PAS domain S-box-containing protein
MNQYINIPVIDTRLLAMDIFHLLMVTMAFFMTAPVYRRDKKPEYLFLLGGLSIQLINYLVRIMLGTEESLFLILKLSVVELLTGFFEAISLILITYFFTIAIMPDSKTPLKWGRMVFLVVIALTVIFIILQYFNLIQDLESLWIVGAPAFQLMSLLVIASALTQLFSGKVKPFNAIVFFICLAVSHIYGLFNFEEGSGNLFFASIYPWPLIFNPIGYFFMVTAIYQKITEDQMQLSDQLSKRGKELEVVTSNLSRLNRLSANLLRTTELKGLIRMILDSFQIELGFKNTALFVIDKESESLRGYKISHLTGAPVSYPQVSIIKNNFISDCLLKAQTLFFGTGHLAADAGFLRDYDLSATITIIPLLTKKEHECHNVHKCNVKNCPIKTWDLSICWLMQTDDCPCGNLSREEKIRKCLKCPAFNLVGIIVLDNRNAKLKINESNVKFLETFANQAGMALQNAFLVDDLSKESTLRTETLRNLPVGVIVLDSDGRIREFNDAMCQISGTKMDSVIGKLYSEVRIADNPLEFNGDIQQILDGVSTGSTGKLYDDTISNGSEVKIINMRLRPILKNLKLSGLILMIEDITSMKELEKQLIRSESLASMGQMAMGIAHEINNPLAGVSGVLQVLENRFEENSSERKAIITAKNDLKRASGIIKDLLKFAKTKPPEKKLVDLNHLVEEASNFIPYQPGGEKVNVVRDLDEKLPLINADPDQIQQVLTNLILNAISALARNQNSARIEFSTWFDRNWVYLEVEDNGIGISPNMLKKIFEPFFTTKGSGKGTGLGLSLCDRIINDHGGLISVRSEAQKGAAFIIKLPRKSD